MDATEIYSTFDNLFKAVERQARRLEELEERCNDLERRLEAKALPFPVDMERELLEVK